MGRFSATLTASYFPEPSRRITPITLRSIRQLLWGVLAWLYQRDFRENGLEVRNLDIEKQAAGLKGYVKPRGQRESRAECPLPSPPPAGVEQPDGSGGVYRAE